MNTTKNTEENDNAKDVVKFLGALISLTFGVLFFFLKLLGNSKSADEREEDILLQGYSHPDHPQHNQYLIDMDIL